MNRFNVCVGLRRSGTSLLMLALRQSGIPILGFKYTLKVEKGDDVVFSCKPTEALRKGNPNGYWELGKITVSYGITKDFKDLGMDGDVIKITNEAFYKSDPEMIDKAIMIIRNPRCVIKSMQKQNIFKEMEFIPAMKKMAEDTQKTLDFIKQHDIPLRTVTYENLISNPIEELKSLCSFIGKGNPEDGAKVINRDLNRSKPIEGNYPGLDELENIYEMYKMQ